jgi:hypothetical protein
VDGFVCFEDRDMHLHRFSHALVLMALIGASMASKASARPARPAPSLPPPAGAVVNVASEVQLQQAVQQIRSNTTIVIAPGTYVLTSTLWIHGNYENVGIRGATSNADDVVLIGPGMAQPNYGAVPFGVWTGDGVNGVTVANLTLRGFYFHPIIFNGGTQNPLVHNVHLIDAGQQFIKVNVDATGRGADNGILEYSVLEYSTTAKDDYTNGLDIHGAANWVVRHNLFQNLVAPPGQLAGAAILAWRGSSGTIVEGNTFLNCARGIMFGGDDTTSPDHSGGMIANNFFYRSASQPGDVGIILSDSPRTQVLNNTLVTSGTYGSPIEVRYPGTVGALIVNNLMDGVIWVRDGATATQRTNYLGASASMFVNAAAGDLHLAATAAAAIDHGEAVAGVVDDWDGESRPQGAAYEIGADERGGSVAARVNVALASNGASAIGSSTHSSGYAPSGAINGDRKGQPWGNSGGWNDGTAGTWPDWLEVDFLGAKTIDEVDVVSVQDNFTAPGEPTSAMTFNLYGLTDFVLQYWTGSQWSAVPGGVVSGNTLVWRQITFAPLTTTKIRIYVTGALSTWSRITEVEAYQAAAPAGHVNMALASNGATAVGSSTHSSGYAPSGAINGDRKGQPWGDGGGWNDGTAEAWPDWLEVDFSAATTIDEVDVFSVQDNFTAPVEPGPSMTFSLYGLTDFTVQYWDGSLWTAVPGGAVSGNASVWRQVTFAPLTTTKIRIYVTGALATWSRITEVEAYTPRP